MPMARMFKGNGSDTYPTVVDRSVNMQWDLSEVLQGAQVPSCAGCAGVLVCRVLRVRKSLMCWVRMLPPLLADAFHASLHLGCYVQYNL